MVFGKGQVISSPAARLFDTSAALLVPVGSAAMTLMLGFMAFTAMRIPERRPPPETGTTIASGCFGICTKVEKTHWKLFDR